MRSIFRHLVVLVAAVIILVTGLSLTTFANDDLSAGAENVPSEKEVQDEAASSKNNDLKSIFSPCGLIGAAWGSATGGVGGAASNCAKDALSSSLEGISDEVQAAVKVLAENCWSCELYVRLFDGLMKVSGEMNKYFLETEEIIAVSVLVLMILLVLKIMGMIGNPFASGQIDNSVHSIIIYLGRIAIVYLLFYAGLSAAMMVNGGNNDHPARLFLVDAPLMIGTEIGAKFIEGGQSQFGTEVNVRQCPNYNGQGGGSQNSYTVTHITLACGLLNSFHQMGVAGIATGTWLAFKAPTQMDNPGIASMISVVLAGIVMAGAFLWFTVVFGLRYLDALLRGLVVVSFLPLFLFFWIFDRTRNIAISGFKSVVFMAAVFAVSGITFLLCNAIMSYGFQKASGGSVSSDAAQSFISSMSSGNFQWLVGGGSEGGTNWLAFFYLMGCWGLATQISKSTFAIAAEFVNFAGGMTGIGEQTESDVKGLTSSVAAKAVPFGK